jgi:hypothetical protein
MATPFYVLKPLQVLAFNSHPFVNWYKFASWSLSFLKELVIFQEIKIQITETCFQITC